MAMSPKAQPLASFHLKHELERWCQREIDEGYPSGGWLALYRIRSYPWERTSNITELEYWAGLKLLIEKTP